MANRTFVRLGALAGACAAFGQAATVFMALISATVIPAETAGFVKPGRAATVSDQRERLVNVPRGSANRERRRRR